MGFSQRIVTLAAATTLVACVSAQTRDAYQATIDRASAPPPSALPAKSSTPAEDDAALARETRYELVARLTLANNADVAESRARSQEAIARVRTVGHLPDLEFKYELWAQPITRPWALGDAQMHMFGLRQAFPAPGVLDAQTRIAVEDANMTLELQRTRELDVLSKARRAYADFYRADHERDLHVDHAILAERLVALAKLQLQISKTSPADVLRIEVELTRLHNEVTMLGASREIARATLNTLMARDVDAPLGPPAEITLSDATLRLADLEATMKQSRPDLAAQAAAIRRGEAVSKAARRAADWPSFMVGADYMLMPGAMTPHNFGLMVQLSLPWLSSRHGDEVVAADKSIAAEKRALDAVMATAILQLRDAAARYEAARALFIRTDGELLPLTRKTIEISEASYAAGGGDTLGVVDAMRSYLQARVDRSRALADVEMSLADLERAVGAPVPMSKSEASTR